MEKITPLQLSKLLFEEFRRESWGDIDPNAFCNPATSDNIYPSGVLPEGFGEDWFEDEMAGLYEVLERVCERINKGDI